MRNIYSNMINDGNKTGLYTLSAPTGAGKSYEAIQTIAEIYKDIRQDQHIFFLTGNLNNLPIDDLRNAMGEEEMRKNVIVVRSYQDYILDNFDIKSIPEQFRTKETHQLDKAISDYKYAKNKYLFNDKSYVDDKLNELVECEKTFRDSIYSFVIGNLKKIYKKENESISNKELSMKIENELKNNKNYMWIGKFYPNIFVKDYKIIFMSVKKFFTTNNPFFESKYSFIKGDISKDAIIFIDEFDATKAIITQTIIENSLKNTNAEFMQMVQDICEKIANIDKQAPSIVKLVIKKHEKQFLSLKKETEKIYENYYVYLKFLYDAFGERNFLFNDFSYHQIFNQKDKRYAYVIKDNTDNKMKIKLIKDKSEMEAPKTIDEKETFQVVDPLYSVIRALNHVVLSFKSFVSTASKTYQDIVNERNTKGDFLNEDQALVSFYNAIDIRDNDISFLMNSYVNIKRSIGDLKLVKTNNFYDRGLRTFEFGNTAVKREETYFKIVEIKESAEYIMASIASKAKVIGMSATAEIESVLCNYNLDYLCNKLGDNFHRTSDEDLKYMREQYEKQNSKYCFDLNPNGEIKVNVHYTEEGFEECGEDIEDRVRTIFKEEKHIRKVVNSLNTIIEDTNYLKHRYLSIAYVFKEFICNEHIKSFLCLTNKLPDEGNKLNLGILKTFFDIIIKENNISINENYVELLKGSGEEFDRNKKRILERLTNGDKIFLMSAYATLGAGQNLPYKPSENDTDLICLYDEINHDDARFMKKDWDGIYLGDITNVTTNLLNTEEEFKLENQYQYLIEMENLYENEEISYGTLNEGIKNSFLKLIDNSKTPYVRIPDKFKSKTGYITKQVIQAVGRLNRTFMKRSEIHIYISKSVFDFFDSDAIEKLIISPEIQAISNFITERRDELNYKKNSFKADHVAMSARNYIYELLGKPWDDEIVELWQELRETVLKYPLVSKLQYEQNVIFKEYYICDDKPMNKYYFNEYYDFSEINVLFAENKEQAIQLFYSLDGKKNKSIDTNIKECSLRNSRLEEILKYPGMKEYFEKNEYATEFTPNDYMMSPVLFQNIYKGAIGEAAGKFILEEELGIKLQELKNEIYEKFDFVLNENIYIDFKHWRKSSVDKEKYLEHISKKLEEVKGKKAYIINILDENDDVNQITVSHDQKIIEVPYLINSKKNVVNHKVIEMLKEDLRNE